MPRWMKPTEELPEVNCGDRIVIIVRERPRADATLDNRLVILEATETGWYCADDTYAGYSVHDGILWTTEKDVCQIADVLIPAR
jgi:hypothetical protein